VSKSQNYLQTMASKQITKQMILIVSIFTTLVACIQPKIEQPTNRCDLDVQGFGLQDSILISPSKELLSLKDTLWFSFSVPMVREGVDFSGSNNFGVLFEVKKLLNKNSTEGALKDFELIISKGKQTPHFLPEQAVMLLVDKGVKDFEYKVGLVPKNKNGGIYFIYYSNSTNVVDNTQATCKVCSYFHNLKCDDQHLELYYDNMPDRPLAPKFAKITYCFGVAD
jgi:hypothetical protein